MTIVQGPNELGRDFSKRIEEEVSKLNIKQINGSPLGAVPSVSAASDGRMTVILTWFEEAEDVDKDRTEYWIEEFERAKDIMSLREFVKTMGLKINQIKS